MIGQLKKPRRLFADAMKVNAPHVEREIKRAIADAVNHPKHYNAGAIECIDAIEAAIGAEGAALFCRGNAIKYLWRAGLKGSLVEDLKKANWYLEREISIRQKEIARGQK